MNRDLLGPEHLVGLALLSVYDLSITRVGDRHLDVEGGEVDQLELGVDTDLSDQVLLLELHSQVVSGRRELQRVELLQMAGRGGVAILVSCTIELLDLLQRRCE